MLRKTLFKSSSVLYNELVKKTRCAACQNETYTNWKRICFLYFVSGIVVGSVKG